MNRDTTYLLIAAVLLAAWAVFAGHDLVRARNMEREIACLRVRVDALQLLAAGECRVPEFDGIPVKRPMAIKY